MLKDETNTVLEKIFSHMDKWRHLPSYQLERRADVFFSVYLKDVVQAHTGTELEDIIVPEMPIKRDLIWPEKKTSKSVKVDYVLFSKSRDVVYFIELKTDSGSRREEQDTYLHRAVKIGLRSILEGLKDIMLHSTAYQKYYHLAHTLSLLGFLEMPQDIEEYLFPEPRSGLKKRLQNIEVTSINPSVEVIYLQPEKEEGIDCIDFIEFAGHLEKYSDPLSTRFRESLLKWRRPAGSEEPSD